MVTMDELVQSSKQWFLGKGAMEAAGIAVAALVMYLVALWVVRTGKKRFLGRNTVFDMILAFMLGSILARAVNGGAPILATAAAGFILIGLHWVFGTIAMRTESFGRVVKGGADQLMRDGECLKEAMAEHHVTRNDIDEAARGEGLHGIDAVEAAYFERNGRISIIPRPKVRVVDITVEEGVQTVRVEVMH